MKKKAINIPSLPAPDASFSRAIKITLGNADLLFISGTASVGPHKETLFFDDFEKQARQAYQNIENILKSEGLELSDVVKWTVFLRDMQYYDRFERVRSAVFSEKGIKRENFPASTAVQAEICRKELLIEMEAIAVKQI
jgi:enamine deaminase RidA (YjgF/YER057c/UK114 family)